jgi:hypothetical protein
MLFFLIICGVSALWSLYCLIEIFRVEKNLSWEFLGYSVAFTALTLACPFVF